MTFLRTADYKGLKGYPKDNYYKSHLFNLLELANKLEKVIIKKKKRSRKEQISII